MGEERHEDPPPLVLPKIYITGHSLGGSLAQLLALDLANNCELVLQVSQQKNANTEAEIFTIPEIEVPASPFAGLTDDLAIPEPKISDGVPQHLLLKKISEEV